MTLRLSAPALGLVSDRLFRLGRTLFGGLACLGCRGVLGAEPVVLWDPRQSGTLWMHDRPAILCLCSDGQPSAYKFCVQRTIQSEFKLCRTV